VYRPPQIVPQNQDVGQKSNIAAEIHKIVFFRVKFVDFWPFSTDWCAMPKTDDYVIKVTKTFQWHPNPRWLPAAILEISSHHITKDYKASFRSLISPQWVIRSTSFFGSRLEFSGLEDRMAPFLLGLHPPWIWGKIQGCPGVFFKQQIDSCLIPLRKP